LVPAKWQAANREKFATPMPERLLFPKRDSYAAIQASPRKAVKTIEDGKSATLARMKFLMALRTNCIPFPGANYNQRDPINHDCCHYQRL
jgi:hypothetical protein